MIALPTGPACVCPLRIQGEELTLAPHLFLGSGRLACFLPQPHPLFALLTTAVGKLISLVCWPLTLCPMAPS